MGRHLVALALLWAGTSCSGIIEDPKGSSDGSGDGPSAAVETRPATGPPARTPTQRLTPSEYDNALTSIFGPDLPGPASGTLPPAGTAARYDRNDVPASVREVELLQSLAEVNAAALAERIEELVDCDAPQERACAETFVASYGRRLFRRPPTPEERASFMSLFDVGLTEGTHRDGYRLVLEALLQSPQFLLRVERIGDPADEEGVVHHVSDWAVASRLSFFLWDGPPDAALLDAAERGELRTPGQIAAQARRMIADTRFDNALAQFHWQWLGLRSFAETEKDEVLHPGFDAELRASMSASTFALVAHVFREDDGTLETLLTAPYAFVDARLAAFYGIAAPPGAGFHRVELDPGRRAGLLTEPSVLAEHANPASTSPVLRGLLVRTWLMCMSVPPPPEDDPEITDFVIDPQKPVRERYADTMRPGSTCAGCHQMFNPIGYGFEHYDATGAWRDIDARVSEEYDGTVDATVQGIAGAPGLEDLTVYGADGLMAVLAGYEPVQRCVTRQWYEYALERTPNGGDGPSIDEAFEAFRSSGLDLRELLIAITTTEAFRTNSLPGPEAEGT